MFQAEILKKAEQKSLSEINILIAQLGLGPVPPKPLEMRGLERMLSQENLRCLVVKDKEKIVGLMVLYFTQIPTGVIAEAEDLIVDEAYRKWGAGPVIVNKAIELAEAEGAKHLSLRTNPKRLEANKMYDELGFKKMETNFYRVNLPRGK